MSYTETYNDIVTALDHMLACEAFDGELYRVEVSVTAKNDVFTRLFNMSMSQSTSLQFFLCSIIAPSNPADPQELRIVVPHNILGNHHKYVMPVMNTEVTSILYTLHEWGLIDYWIYDANTGAYLLEGIPRGSSSKNIMTIPIRNISLLPHRRQQPLTFGDLI